MLAYAFLAVTRTREADRTNPDMIALTCNEIRPLLIVRSNLLTAGSTACDGRHGGDAIRQPRKDFTIEPKPIG